MRRETSSLSSLYPARESEDIVKVFVTRYGGALFILALAFALVLFVAVIMATVPPTESGLYYYHMN